jgi:NAD(P)-dependent dehydrogenase (short-subunit alcohol dehydrogenase family)
VVTGASRGIGAAIAEALAQRGADLALLARDVAPLEALASRLPVRALAIATDVSDPESVHAAFERIRGQFPRIDILVNNAGQARSAPFTRTDFALWQSMLAVNLNGAFLCAQEVYAAMVKQDYGRIINIASAAGLTGMAYVSAYCAAKHGLVGLTRALAREAAASSLTVNAVCPGYTETDMVKEAVANIIAKTGKSAAEARAALVANNPQRRMIQPAEVANAVLWLCLPGSESVTGQAIVLAGGEIM